MAILELTGIEKRFGGLPAVDGVTFTVDEGEIVALVGPNGAGKSTLLKAIGGMQSASAGTVLFGGVDITHYPSHRARQAGVAMVLQTPRPFGTMTVRENVALGALFGGERLDQPAALRRADEMLAIVDLADRRDESATSLNLHEQRLLEIARQLAGRPRLVLLDEVMAGLRPAEARQAVELIKGVRDDGVTVVFIEHVMPVVRDLADRVLVMDHGRELARGTYAEVTADERVVRAYLGDPEPEEA